MPQTKKKDNPKAKQGKKKHHQKNLFDAPSDLETMPSYIGKHSLSLKHFV